MSSEDDSKYLPKNFSLDRVYPNPFNPATSISFSVPYESIKPVSINIFDISGRLATKLIDKKTFDPGRHEVDWGASNFGTGIYFIEFKAGMKRQVKKVTLIK